MFVKINIGCRLGPFLSESSRTSVNFCLADLYHLFCPQCDCCLSILKSLPIYSMCLLVDCLYLVFGLTWYVHVIGRLIIWLLMLVTEELSLIITVSSLKVLFWCLTLFHYLSLSIGYGWGCEALLSGDLEGGHTDQGNAAGRAAHPKNGEWVISEWVDWIYNLWQVYFYSLVMESHDYITALLMVSVTTQ